MRVYTFLVLMGINSGSVHFEPNTSVILHEAEWQFDPHLQSYVCVNFLQGFMLMHEPVISEWMPCDVLVPHPGSMPILHPN